MRYQAVREWAEASNTRQLVLVEHGETVVDDTYGDDGSDPGEIASVQKSATSIVLGQLINEGKIDLDAPLSEYLGPGWTKAPRPFEDRITVRFVATLRTGLDDALEPDGEPGRDWYYCNNAYHELRRALEVIEGVDTNTLFADRLFGRLGMASSSWYSRPWAPALMGLESTAADLARLGVAVLRRDDALGCTPDYLDLLTTPSSANPTYGLLWWLFESETGIVTGHRRGEEPSAHRRFGGIELTRRRAPSAPLDTIAGSGAGDQRLYICPSRDLVAVRLGRPVAEMNAAAGPFDEEFWSRMPDQD